MCLAVPGKLIEIIPADEGATGPSGLVDFQGSRLKVGLAFVPEAEIGDWLLVHAGFAISCLDEEEAGEVWELLQHDDQFAGLVPGGTAEPQPPS